MTTAERISYQTGKNNKYSNFSYQPDNVIDKYIISLVETRDKMHYLLDKRKFEQEKQVIAKDIIKEIQKEFKKAFN